MTTSTLGLEEIKHLNDLMISEFFQGIFTAVKLLFWPLLKMFLSPLIPTIIIGIVFVIVLIVFVAMTFGRLRQSNGLAPSTNRLIGSLSYLIVHSGVIFICWEIWHFDMLDKGIFYMLHLIAFMLVRIILLATEVWVY